MASDIDLPIPQLLDVVGIGRAALVAFPRRLTGLQLHCAHLVRDQRRTRPLVIGLLGQQMPAQHGQLARHGDGRDLVTAPGSDAQKERAQRAWRLGCRPGRLDQHGARMRTAALADAAMLRQTEAGLPHPRVQADIAHELLRDGEAAHVADRRDQAGRDDQVDAGDGQQALDCRIVDQPPGDLSVENLEILAEPVEFAQMPLDRGPLVVGQRPAVRASSGPAVRTGRHAGRAGSDAHAGWHAPRS